MDCLLGQGSFHSVSSLVEKEERGLDVPHLETKGTEHSFDGDS